MNGLRNRRSVIALMTVVSALAAYSLVALAACGAGTFDGYDAVVRGDAPAGYWTMGHPGSGTEANQAGSGLTGTYTGSPHITTMPNGAAVADFDGEGQYLQVPDADLLSPATNGVLTIEAWIRPDTLDFGRAESEGYVHWMGKGEQDNQEYVCRIYSAHNEADRPNRISGYLFNPSGGLGAGSYFQDPVRAGEWIHYVLVINSRATSADYPHGYTKIYKDGVLRDQDDLSIDGKVIKPARGGAPLRIGTRDMESFFAGAVGKVAIYDRELAADRIAHHFEVMTGKQIPAGEVSTTPAALPAAGHSASR